MKTSTFAIDGQEFDYVPLETTGSRDVASLPFSLKVLLENLLRNDRPTKEVSALIGRNGAPVGFNPSRLILQDMLGLPLLTDLVAMRDKVVETGGDPESVGLQLPVDLVVDHAMTVFHFASSDALARNQQREFEANRERFAFMRQCEKLFSNLRIVPPGSGIMHQINIENLARCVIEKRTSGNPVLSPDTVLGTDSHTPMVNGIGVLGWGIGGLDAEAIMLGFPIIFNVPEVLGIRVSGRLPDGTTATDLALRVAERLRAEGVVGRFVEFFGPGLDTLLVTDRGTVANMAPEYGATCVYFPIDDNTVNYLKATGRGASAALAEPYARKMGLWRDREGAVPEFEQVIELDLSTIGRSVSAPRRPEQRLDLGKAKDALAAELGDRAAAPRVAVAGKDYELGNGDVIIAAITSCTNTANPHAMITAGLVARNAARRGLTTKPWVKTSLAPGSRVVAAYLEESGLQKPLDALGFNVVGFACTTCNGMSGPLEKEIDAAIRENDLTCAAVLSGNRNFEGRIHELSRLNVLASPPLVVAYALAGTILTDIENDVIAEDGNGEAVRLSDLWPTRAEVEDMVCRYVTEERYTECYASLTRGTELWQSLPQPEARMSWDDSSTYVRKPPFFREFRLGYRRRGSTASGRLSFSAIRSRPTTCRRPAIFRWEALPPTISWNRASNPRISTRSAHVGQTGRSWCGRPSPTPCCATR